MHQILVMSMTDVSESDIVDALRAVISRRKLKLVDLAKSLDIPYRSLQNYMYKKARMPLDVYIRLCSFIGITADYPIQGRFKLAHHDLQNALIEVFGEEFFNSIDFDEHLRWTMTPRRERDQARVRRTAGSFAIQIAAEYDLNREGNLRPEDPED